MGRKRSIEQTIFLMFALIVFIIVAVVVLQMFLRGTGSVEKLAKQTSLEGATKECENYASSNIIAYCTAIYEIDLNGDNRYSSVSYQRKGNLMVCEKSLFCWSLVDNIPGERCMLELCRYYIYTAHLSPEEATLKVFGYYTTDQQNSLTIGDREEFKNTMLDFENYKSKKKDETGFIFIDTGCASDEVVAGVYRGLANTIFTLLDQNAGSYELGLAKYGNTNYRYLYIGRSAIKRDVVLKIASLYGNDPGRVPNQVPLCALLAFA